ncbi:hypothetical protein CCS38_10260 [Streptomyces purpurogeneiscleroticus]|nr:hypothetical protein [Streptomyces purpurogeneiscleroticus]
MQVWQDLSFQPDDSYDNKIFTACYSGGNTSSGEWSEIPQESGQFYFQITSVGGRTSYSSSVDVDKVYVDTAKP